MAMVDRSEVENEYKTKLDKLLNPIKLFETKCGNYFEVQPYLSEYFRPASKLVGHRLELLKWLLTSINCLEMEFEFNNRIMEKYSLLEEEVEEVCLVAKHLFDSKCLDAEAYDALRASKCDFNCNYSVIWANRQKSDHYFLELFPGISEQLTSLLPVGFTKSPSPSQSDELIIEFLTTIATFEDETALKKAFDEFFDEAKKFNDFLNAQYQSDLESVKAFLDLGSSFEFNRMFCEVVLGMQRNKVI